jgi:hypothetical protein
MKNTAGVSGGKPIAVFLQPISGVSAINPLVAFYDIHGRKREVLFYYFVPDTRRKRERESAVLYFIKHDDNEAVLEILSSMDVVKGD